MKNEIKAWILKIQQNESLPNKKIIAFNFGLIETEDGYSIYLIGSEKYDEFDDDWACEEDFAPKQKYLQLSQKYHDLEWEEIEELIVNSLNEYLKTEEFRKSFLFNAEAITTGFDDGELIRIK